MSSPTLVLKVVFSFLALWYLLAFGLLARMLVARFRGKLPPHSRLFRVFQWIIWGGAAAGFLGFLYARFLEPRWLAVTRLTLRTAKLPAGSQAVRLAHFSDLHVEPGGLLEERLCEALEREHPDLILFTGDAANVAEGVPRFRETLARAARVAPLFAVRGNWDTSQPWAGDLYPIEGVRLLDGETASWEGRGVKLGIAGLTHGRERQLQTLAGEQSSERFTILLYHTPDLGDEAAEGGAFDLYLAGHTHGGQVALPLYGALITLSKHGKRFEGGMYRVGHLRLYVNRGIGMQGGDMPRVRFCARPELTIIDLLPETEAAAE